MYPEQCSEKPNPSMRMMIPMALQKQILMQADENSSDKMEKLKYIFKHT